jgi:hypothetical protein
MDGRYRQHDDGTRGESSDNTLKQHGTTASPVKDLRIQRGTAEKGSGGGL